MSLVSKKHNCGMCGGERNERVHFGRRKLVVGYLCDSCDSVYLIELYQGNARYEKRDVAIKYFGKIQEHESSLS